MSAVVQWITAPRPDIVTKGSWTMTMAIRIRGQGAVAVADIAGTIEKFIKEQLQ